jgi:AcrR family transcriptional regulator
MSGDAEKDPIDDDHPDDDSGDDTEESEPSTEDEIRWAAYDVLVEKGFDAFTTQKVADAAGVSQSLVHYYYDTKADLVYAVFANGVDYLAAAVEERADTADPRERLLTLARYMLRGEGMDGLDAAVDFARLLLEIEAQAPYDERLRDAIEHNQEFLESYVADAVREGIEAGQFRDVDPEAFAATYVAAIGAGQNRRAIFADLNHVEPVLTGLEALVDDYLLEAES